MKADLYIGENSPVSIEIVSPPRLGEKVIFKGRKLWIRGIAHDADKKKLRIMCNPPDAPPIEPAPETQITDEDTDMEDSDE